MNARPIVMTIALTALVTTLGMVGCATVNDGVDRAAEFSATRINRYCAGSPATRAAVANKVGPYLEPGNGVHCTGDLVARY